uniref:Uncharacterized protein n=1 Tax=Arundo donax TaxID=35708 RepID=A0A0A9F4L2_ARUDO
MVLHSSNNNIIVYNYYSNLNTAPEIGNDSEKLTSLDGCLLLDVKYELLNSGVHMLQ